MSFIFYALGIIFLIYELGNIYGFEQRFKDVQSLKEKAKQSEKDNNTDVFTSQDKNKIFFQGFYMTWTLIGLFSSQWILFLVLLLLSVTMDKLCKWTKYGYLIDGVVSFVLLLFIILNRFHFDINIDDYLYNLWLNY